MQALMRNSGLASQVISLPPFQVDLSAVIIYYGEVIKLTRSGIHHYGNVDAIMAKWSARFVNATLPGCGAAKTIPLMY